MFIYSAILEHSPTKPVLIFVSSRRQTRLTALDLISYCAADDDPKRFLHLPEEEIETLSETVTDRALRDCLLFGIGIHHAGLDPHDRGLVEELFLTNKIQVLVCTSTLACKFFTRFAHRMYLQLYLLSRGSKLAMSFSDC
jgi:activating signal cointegrator complex subunit 3